MGHQTTQVPPKLFLIPSANPLVGRQVSLGSGYLVEAPGPTPEEEHSCHCVYPAPWAWGTLPGVGSPSQTRCSQSLKSLSRDETRVQEDTGCPGGEAYSSRSGPGPHSTAAGMSLHPGHCCGLCPYHCWSLATPVLVPAVWAEHHLSGNPEGTKLKWQSRFSEACSTGQRRPGTGLGFHASAD